MTNVERRTSNVGRRTSTGSEISEILTKKETKNETESFRSNTYSIFFVQALIYPLLHKISQSVCQTIFLGKYGVPLDQSLRFTVLPLICDESLISQSVFRYLIEMYRELYNLYCNFLFGSDNKLECLSPLRLLIALLLLIFDPY